MNCYIIDKKGINTIEKNFSSTVMGKRARVPVILSILFMVVWITVTLSLISLECACAKWAMMNNIKNISFVSSEPMSYFIAFLIVVLMCIISYIHYNRELRRYIESL